jgi:hypothetical protein
MFPFVSSMSTRVFAWPSQRRWNSAALKPSRLPRHSSLKSLPENSCSVNGQSDTISESSSQPSGGVGAAVHVSSAGKSQSTKSITGVAAAVSHKSGTGDILKSALESGAQTGLISRIENAKVATTVENKE